MKKDDVVICRCKNPAFGFVTRVGKDWVDVEWHGGVGYSHRARAKKVNVIKIMDTLNQVVANARSTYMP